MSIDKILPIKSDAALCVCIRCEKARIGADLWDDYKLESLLNPALQITHGLCPQCESQLQHSLGLMSRLQAF